MPYSAPNIPGRSYRPETVGGKSYRSGVQPGPPRPWKAEMTSQAAQPLDTEATIHEPSAQEWERARDAALAEVGLTYDELAEQARTRNFQSARALSLWVTFGNGED
jgi:hypothetical protein